MVYHVPFFGSGVEWLTAEVHPGEVFCNFPINLRIITIYCHHSRYCRAGFLLYLCTVSL